MGTTAELVRPVLEALVGPNPPVAFRFWDGSTVGPQQTEATVVVRSPQALRRILWSPGELGAARAYVVGDIDVEGDMYAALSLRDVLDDPEHRVRLAVGPSDWLTMARIAAKLRVLGPPLPRPPEEARLSGGRHSKERDALAIAHHYDVSNDFYRIVLGETMTYSCAFFPTATTSLDDAQLAKYDLICKKLGLRPGMRMLDVGCGWGGMARFAAEHYGVSAVGITVSHRQVELARQRTDEAGLAAMVEIRLQDYRELRDGPFDAICSIGMFEHVGLARLGEYLDCLHRLLRPEGRLLNHGISRPAGPSGLDRKSFVAHYVFPDGELHEVGRVVSAVQATGLEARDVESLREHYARTLRHWVANLEAAWDRAVSMVGPNRARVWRLYMAGSALAFESNRTSIHQVLATRTAPGGRSGMPCSRAELLGFVAPAPDGDARDGRAGSAEPALSPAVNGPTAANEAAGSRSGRPGASERSDGRAAAHPG